MTHLHTACPDNDSSPPPPCPLCLDDRAAVFFEDSRGSYFECPACALVFLHPRFHVSPEREKARYDRHRNGPDDPGYRRFLGRLLEPMAAALPAGAEGLDYGSGPGPTLSRLFAERGFPVTDYDPFYSTDEGALRRTYDFIACTEAIEHFRAPRREWDRMLGLVRKGGLIGIMTEFRRDSGAFAAWHYRNDETHVCFFSEATFRWMAGLHALAVRFSGSSIALFRVPE